MIYQENRRQQRRSAAKSMAALAFSGIAGVIAIAVVALWFNWPDSSTTAPVVEVDPMSMIG